MVGQSLRLISVNLRKAAPFRLSPLPLSVSVGQAWPVWLAVTRPLSLRPVKAPATGHRPHGQDYPILPDIFRNNFGAGAAEFRLMAAVDDVDE
jgi:hypothetical protein